MFALLCKNNANSDKKSEDEKSRELIYTAMYVHKYIQIRIYIKLNEHQTQSKLFTLYVCEYNYSDAGSGRIAFSVHHLK